jgi:hypothetical protein
MARVPRSMALFGTVFGLFVGAPAAEARDAARCRFDQARMSFVGSPREQARCLLRHVQPRGEIGPALPALPPTLERLVGERAQVSADRLSAYLAANRLSVGALDRRISSTVAGIAARYFVIHDTSSPYYGVRPLPADVDGDAVVNNLADYHLNGRDPAKYPRAHAFVNRRGEIFVGHDFSVPWRATQFEMRTGEQTRGLFVHIENVQPRRRDPAIRRRNDAIAPDPGLSDAQYQTLAALYVVASARAGRWLIPGFHAVVDIGFGSHDDPQHFDLTRFDNALASVLSSVGG